MSRLYEIQQDKDHMANQSDTLESLRTKWERAKNYDPKSPGVLSINDAFVEHLFTALEEKQAIINQNHEGALWSEAERRRLREYIIALRELIEYADDLLRNVLPPNELMPARKQFLERANRVLKETKP